MVDGGYPNLILDDGGDATLLCVLGPKAEKDPSVLNNPQNEEEEALFTVMKRYLKPKSPASIRPSATPSAACRKKPPRASTACTRWPEGRAAVPGHQRQRQRHQVEVRQPVRLP
jgi:hypothetical protein